MKRFALIGLLLLSAGACAGAPPAQAPASHGLTLHGKVFQVELATDEPAREKGLMFRTRMADDHGMLFVFPQEQPQWFWMKNTLIPLDILYFDGDRKLVSMQLAVPPCKADPCPTYPSDKPARYVLELNAGTAARLGIGAGDRFSLDGAVGPVR